jgi:squalene-hopene/tetraprenyl-beta-curcumene cyclase
MSPSAARISALERAWEFLVARALEGFPDSRHEMNFPRAQGFTGESERQGCDNFARAVLGSLMLDLGELRTEWASEARAIAEREAAYGAASKVTDRAGGWSYFPGLPELPPDLDSLAAVTSLFARASRDHLPLCEEPIALALSQRKEDGAIDTWLVAPSDAPNKQMTMKRAIAMCWGNTVDADVLARFYRALALLDGARYEGEITAGAMLIESLQGDDGAWLVPWYAGPYYGTTLCLEMLWECGKGEAAVEKATGFLQNAAENVPLSPMSAALTLWGLHAAGEEISGFQRAINLIGSTQREDGSWPAEPWIQMAMGRAAGRVARILTWGSTTITTALCLRTLAAISE